MRMVGLALTVAFLGYNVYGIMSVGVAHASTMQWVATIVMLVFVVLRVVRMLSSRR